MTWRGAPADLEVLTALAAVERAAVALYEVVAARALLDAATAAMTGTFAMHHLDHAGAYEAALVAVGRAAPVTASQMTIDEFAATMVVAPDAMALLGAAHALEEALVSTALDAVGRLDDPSIAALIAQRAPVGAQHASVLGAALGRPDPDPDVRLDPSFAGSLLDG